MRRKSNKSHKMLYVSKLVFACTFSCVFASIFEELNCLSKFDNDYKILQKLVELEHKQKEQEKLIENLTRQYETVKKEAAFSAYLTPDLENVKNLQVIVFNDVQTNVGEVYSARTGKFTCKNAGVYVFYWTITNKDTTYMDSELVVNGEQRSQAFSDAGNHNDYAVASNVVIAELKVGDEIWIRVGTYHDGFLSGAHRSSFSGWLLYSR